MKLKFKNAAKYTLIATGCFSMGFIGALQISPVLAQNSVPYTQSIIEPELQSALRHHFQNKFFKLIEASESQRKEISTLFDNQFEYAKPIRQEMLQKGIALVDKMKDESVSDSELIKEIDSVKELKESIAQKRRSTMLKVRALLTKEQKELMAAKIKARLTGNPRLGMFLNEANGR